MNRFITGARSAMNIPAQHIQEGDFLLAWNRQILDMGLLPRGSIVTGRFQMAQLLGNARSFNTLRSRSLAVAQIVGCPGETVDISGGQYRVDGIDLDPEMYPMPDWLTARELSVEVPAGHYLVSTAYYVRGAIEIPDDLIIGTLLVPAEELDGLAFIRWLPVMRRGFLPS
jgi:hypothetical protein